MKFRKFNNSDKGACLSIFDSNVPVFLSPKERSKFIEFLDGRPRNFYIVEDHKSNIIACGGYNYRPKNDTVKLRWGMVHKSQQGRGVGSFLLMERINMIRSEFSTPIILDTSQHTAGFYQRYGFQTLEIVEDGIAPGFDHHMMEMKPLKD